MLSDKEGVAEESLVARAAHAGRCGLVVRSVLLPVGLPAASRSVNKVPGSLAERRVGGRSTRAAGEMSPTDPHIRKRHSGRSTV